MIARLALLFRRRGKPVGASSTASQEAVINIRIHVDYDDLDGFFIAQCVDLPGCMSYGSTEREAVENVVEAITGVLSVRMQRQVREAALETSRPSEPFGRDLALTV
jgi:predicted RNase H-like HicB family nuclease